VLHFEAILKNFQGNGAVQNNGEAVGWFQKAADKGHVGAQRLLAHVFR
jgi:TPR repeat protein